MRKTLFALLLATATQAASAMPTIHNINAVHSLDNSAYSVGYQHGKNTAYNNAARTLFVVGLVAMAGVIIYHYGQESRWTTNEKGVVYRF